MSKDKHLNVNVNLEGSCDQCPEEEVLGKYLTFNEILQMSETSKATVTISILQHSLKIQMVISLI